MKNKRIIDSWNKIGLDHNADERILDAILARKHKLYERQERRADFLLCLIQIALFIMTLSIVTTVFILNQGIVGVFLIIYVATGGFISVAVILAYSKSKKI